MNMYKKYFSLLSFAVVLISANSKAQFPARTPTIDDTLQSVRVRLITVLRSAFLRQRLQKLRWVVILH